METISYHAIELEAKKLAARNKRAPFVRILNLLAFILGFTLIVISKEKLSFWLDESAAGLLSLILVIVYMAITVQINQRFSFPVKVRQKDVEVALREVFRNKEQFFLTEINIKYDEADYYEYKALEAKDEHQKLLDSFEGFKKIQTEFAQQLMLST